mmetsp:Transcript_23979/g.58040  ORF Transcript_23979/g.58040 Transcript_23979/m.58040 type:complete len:277 (-) Transcript_23979:252-1082(-)
MMARDKLKKRRNRIRKNPALQKEYEAMKQRKREEWKIRNAQRTAETAETESYRELDDHHGSGATVQILVENHPPSPSLLPSPLREGKESSALNELLQRYLRSMPSLLKAFDRNYREGGYVVPELVKGRRVCVVELLNEDSGATPVTCTPRTCYLFSFRGVQVMEAQSSLEDYLRLGCLPSSPSGKRYAYDLQLLRFLEVAEQGTNLEHLIRHLVASWGSPLMEVDLSWLQKKIYQHVNVLVQVMRAMVVAHKKEATATQEEAGRSLLRNPHNPAFS